MERAIRRRARSVASEASAVTSQFHIIQPQRREVEDAVAGADVAVELVLLQVLNQRAAGAVDDALRHAGRARGDTGCRADGRTGAARTRTSCPSPESRNSSHTTARSRLADRRLCIDVWHHDHASDGWAALRAISCEAHEAVVRLAAVDVAVGGDEDLGSIWPKRSSTPWTPKSGEHEDQTAPMAAAPSAATIALRQVRQKAGDAIAGPDARVQQRRRRTTRRRHASSRHVSVRRRPARREEDRRLTVPATEQVLGEVQPRVRKEARARHPLGILDGHGRRARR